MRRWLQSQQTRTSQWSAEQDAAGQQQPQTHKTTARATTQTTRYNHEPWVTSQTFWPKPALPWREMIDRSFVQVDDGARLRKAVKDSEQDALFRPAQQVALFIWAGGLCARGRWRYLEAVDERCDCLVVGCHEGGLTTLGWTNVVFLVQSSHSNSSHRAELDSSKPTNPSIGTVQVDIVTAKISSPVNLGSAGSGATVACRGRFWAHKRA